MEYIRKCPLCKNDIIYTGLKAEQNGKNAEKNNKCCRKCVSEKMSIKYKGTGNPFYNKKHTIESIEKQSIVKKGKHLSTKTEFKKGHNLNDINNPPNFSLSKIMDNSYESLYWLGFILADGSFHKNRFEFSLQQKDLECLKSFCLYIGNPPIYKKGNSYRTFFNNKIANKEFCELYDIKDRKTYNPPSFELFYDKYTDNQLYALLFGLIDGDGSIYVKGNNKSICITFHKNWYDFYKSLFAKLQFYCNFANVKDKNIMTLNIRRKKEIHNLYEKLVSLNINYLERKWKKVEKI
jgi:hypothetical protein